METVTEIFEILMYAIITGAGIMIADKVLGFLNGKIDELQVSTKLSEYKRLNVLIDGTQVLVTSVVKSVSQTYVDVLKASGSFNEEAQKNAKETALVKAKELLSAEAIEAIEKLHGNVDMYLDVLIEKVVLEIKKTK